MEGQKLNYWFPLKAWLTTVIIIGPLLLTIFGSLNITERFIHEWSDLWIIVVIILYGLVFSLPTLLVSYLVFIQLNPKRTLPVWAKIIIGTVAVLGAIITFRLMGGFMTPIIFVSYTAASILSCLPYKVYKIKKMDSNE